MTNRLPSLDELPALCNRYRKENKVVVATSGIFDLLHSGHVQFLEEAKSLGHVLVVGLNSDSSTRRVKGPDRPIVPENERASMLVALRAVDHAALFDDLTPHRFLSLLKPAIYCKASDYTLGALPERDVVIDNGGEVRLLALRPGLSTSLLVSRILASSRHGALPAENGETGRLNGWQSAMEQMLSSANVVRQSAYLFAEAVDQIAQRIAAAAAGDRIWVCGDESGSAVARHFAAELARALQPRQPRLIFIPLLPEPFFSHEAPNDETDPGGQLERAGSARDILLALSLKGGSEATRRVMEIARRKGVYIVALTGEHSTTYRALADSCLEVPSSDALTTHQVHLCLLQALCRRLTELAPPVAGNTAIH